MRTAPQRAAWLGATALALVPALAHAQSPAVPSEVTLDFDHDGKLDRAVLVDRPAEGSTDLYIYLGAGAGKRDPSLKPTIVKRHLTNARTLRFEATAKGSLIVMWGCGGCSNDFATTLTIVHRRGALWVGGVTYDWDTRAAIGTCDIDFLAGKGLRSDGPGAKAEPIKGRFRPIKLADWSEDMRPKACD